MGPIQSAVNEGLTGTAFLLRQTPYGEEWAKNHTGERALKRENISFSKAASEMEAEVNKKDFDLNKRYGKSILDEMLNLVEQHSENIDTIKKEMPKYEGEMRWEDAIYRARSNFMQDLENEKKKAAESLSQKTNMLKQQKERQQAFIEALKNPKSTTEEIRKLAGGLK